MLTIASAHRSYARVSKWFTKVSNSQLVRFSATRTPSYWEQINLCQEEEADFGLSLFNSDIQCVDLAVHLLIIILSESFINSFPLFTS